MKLKSSKRPRCRGSAITLAAGAVAGMLALPAAVRAGSYFNTFQVQNSLGGASLRGHAYHYWGNAKLISLTDAFTHQTGSLILPELDPGYRPWAINAHFDVYMGEGTGGEGMSFSFGDLPASGAFGEQGSGSGLRVVFDTRANNPGDTAGQIRLYYNNALVGQTAYAGGAAPFRTSPSPRNVSLSVSQSGAFTVRHNAFMPGSLVLSGTIPNWRPQAGWRAGFGAATSTVTDFHLIDNVSVSTTPTATHNWISPTGGTLESASHWHMGLVPTDRDYIRFDLDATYAVTPSSAATTHLGLNMTGGNPTLDLTGGKQFLSTTYAALNSLNGTARVKVSGAAGEFFAAEGIQVGAGRAALAAGGAPARGVIYADGGAAVLGRYLEVGLHGGVGEVHLDGAGTRYHATTGSSGQDVYVGNGVAFDVPGSSSEGVVRVSGGATVALNARGGTLIGVSGGTGLLEVTGAGSTWTGNTTQIGNRPANDEPGQRPASGTLRVANGAAFAAGYLDVGRDGGEGEVTVDGAGSTLTASTIQIGVNVYTPEFTGSSGRLTVTGGGVVTAGHLGLGFGSAGGTLDVTGAGSAVSANQIIVGEGEHAGGDVVTNVMTVSAGAAVQANASVEVGMTAMTPGALDVSGADTTIDAASLKVGGSIASYGGGNGVVTIRDGATVNVGTLDIAPRRSSAGAAAPYEARVDVAGATVNVTTAHVAGEMNLGDGALLEVSGDGTVGTVAGEVPARLIVGGHVQETGAQADAAFGKRLFIGGSQTAAGALDAEVRVRHGSEIDVTGYTKLWRAGSKLVAESAGTFTTSRIDAAAGTVRIEGGTVRLTGDPALVGYSRIARLEHLGSGQLDIGGGGLLLEGTAEQTVATIGALIAAGHNAGTWDGPGIVTSGADALTGLTSLGYAVGDQVGHPLASGDDILVMYTYGGDANLDGFISGDDYAAIDFAVAVPGATGWFNGDFNHDGIISGDDYATIDFNIVAQGAPFPTSPGFSGVGATAVAVPEPALGLTVSVMLAGLLRPRRCRRPACKP